MAEWLQDVHERWLVTILLTLALVVPSLWDVLTTAGATSGDFAIIELRVRDVLSAHPPLVGAYSRYGWDHPGPLLFWLAALPYRLFGGGGQALRLAALLLNAVALVALMRVAGGRGRAAWFAVTGAAVALVVGLPADALASPWNVTITHLALMAFAVGCWSYWYGDGGISGWVALLAGTFVVQSHVGVGVVIAPLALATLTLAVVRWWQAGAAPSRAWPFGAAVSAVWVLPVVVNAAVDPPGNLARILRWSVTNDEPDAGWATALRLVGRTSSATFLGEPRLDGGVFLYIEVVETGFLPGLSLLLLAGAALVAARRGWRSELVWCAVIGSLWVSGTIAAASISLPLGWWLVEWLEPLGWLTWSSIVLVGWRLVAPLLVASRPSLARTATAVPLAGLVLLGSGALVHAVDVVRSHESEPFVPSTLDHLADATQGLGTTPISVAIAGEPILAESLLAGYVTALEVRGIETCVDRSLSYKFGDHRVCGPEVATQVLLRHEPSAVPPPPGAMVLAIVDPLTEEERRFVDRTRLEVGEILVRDGRADQVPVLDTALAGAVLVGDPSDELRGRREDIERLGRLFAVDGDRYGLYRLPD